MERALRQGFIWSRSLQGRMRYAPCIFKLHLVDYRSICVCASSNIRPKSIPFVLQNDLRHKHSFRICDVEILEYSHRTPVALKWFYNAVDKGTDAMLQPPLELAFLCEHLSVWLSCSQTQEVQRGFHSVPSSRICHNRRAIRAVSRVCKHFASSW